MTWQSPLLIDYLMVATVLKIVWIDIVLSGDNAVVVAMACRNLPPRQRRIGIVLGVVLAIVLRIVLALGVSLLLGVPFVKAVGAAVLFYIAVKVILGESEEDAHQKSSERLMVAIGLIAVADLTMSLDNVVAVAAAAGGSATLFILGLLLSMPLMIVGASAITGLINRFPVIVWAGGGLLGWIAGEMLASDNYIMTRMSEQLNHAAEWGSGIAGVLLVVAIAALIRWRRSVTVVV